jgi:hypothetical protein
MDVIQVTRIDLAEVQHTGFQHFLSGRDDFCIFVDYRSKFLLHVADAVFNCYKSLPIVETERAIQESGTGCDVVSFQTDKYNWCRRSVHLPNLRSAFAMLRFSLQSWRCWA